MNPISPDSSKSEKEEKPASNPSKWESRDVEKQKESSLPKSINPQETIDQSSSLPPAKKQKTQLTNVSKSNLLVEKFFSGMSVYLIKLKDKFQEYADSFLKESDSEDLTSSEEEKRKKEVKFSSEIEDSTKPKEEKKHKKEERLSNELENLQVQIIDQINKSIELENFVDTNWKLKVGDIDYDNSEKDNYVDFLFNIFINHLKSQTIFAIELKNFLKNNKQIILDNFINEGKNYKSESIKISIKSSNGETHNRGKKPVFIEFKDKENLILKVVIKPRSAIVDLSIIELFKQINSFDSADKSGPDLPTYQIRNFNMEGEEWSVWQFIEGSPCEIDAETTLKQLKDPSKAKMNLERLENICRNVGITDLHRENILFQNDEWFPIDLEVINVKQSTGLYANPPKTLVILSAKELELIKKFNDNQKELPIRFVPIPTAEFLEHLILFEGAKKISESIKNTLNKSFILKEVNLTDLIHSDYQNGDIPIFIKKGKNIFYGNPINNIVIATEKS